MQRSWKIFLTTLGIGLLCLCTYSLGVWSAPLVRSLLGIETVTAGGGQITVFNEAWSLVMQHYVDRSKINSNAMEYGAIRGMLTTLDDPDHTRFLTAKEYGQQEHELQGRVSGLGVVISGRSGQAVIDQVYPHSPAAAAGLQLGDRIVAVGGVSTSGLDPSKVAEMIRGPIGTAVALTIAPANGASVRTLSVTRQVIHAASVRWELLPETTIADFAVHNFSMGTTTELRTAVQQATAAGGKEFIIDLRNDPGGLLDEAVSAASAFLPSGTVLVERDAQGREQRIAVQGNPVDIATPIVLLVNRGTASAAEIFAAALRDNHRAELVGTQTLGTGTVLSTYRLADGSALFLGTQEWLTPDGTSLWRHGLTPDVVATLPPNIQPIFPGTLEFPRAQQQMQTLPDVVLERGISLLKNAAESGQR
ncbi:MAG: S41 family peptidase [Chloroflexi bacterium]|nr:S41 family peptidase [Chloroflexota bacterium]